jgi:hypothetical protein
VLKIYDFELIDTVGFVSKNDHCFVVKNLGGEGFLLQIMTLVKSSFLIVRTIDDFILFFQVKIVV